MFRFLTQLLSPWSHPEPSPAEEQYPPSQENLSRCTPSPTPTSTASSEAEVDSVGEEIFSQEELIYWQPSDNCLELYVPHGRWKWAKGLPMLNPLVLQDVHTDLRE